MDKELFHAVEHYISTLFAPQDDALQAARQSLTEAEMPQISVSPNQGKFLHVLALLCNARRILEIGTLAGYSAIWMARALPDDGRLITLEHDPKHASVARKNIALAGLEAKIEIRVGKAQEMLAQLEQEETEPFDMVFIDADKPPYVEYFHWALRLARPGALIIADNVIRDGKVLETVNPDQSVAGIQRFNTMLAAHPGVTVTIAQTVGVKGYDGMALAVVKPDPAADNPAANLIDAQEIIMSGSYANIYRRAREALEVEAEMRLKRSLTERERNLFRNCGTLTALESLGMKVYFAESAEELEARLSEISMDSRFGLAIDELMQRLAKFLGRTISERERQQLRKLGNIEALWALEQNLHTVESAQREATFARLLLPPPQKAEHKT